MAIEKEQRNYNLTDPELCMYTSNLCMYMTRDLSDLSIFGVTAPKIAALKALGDAFELFPSDEVLLAYITGIIEEKNSLMEQVKEQIRNMITRCQLKWGEDSWQVTSLTVKGMNNLVEDSLLTVARRVHEQMTEFLPDLGDYGLTQQVLDDFATLNEAFEIAKNNVSKKTSEREFKTKERIDKGNELYKMVVDYCEIGKRVYVKKNTAKYNDYIIYAPPVGPVKPPIMIGYRPGDFVISWNLVENATSYELEYSPDGSAWTVAYSGSDDAVQYIPAVEGWAYFRCRARNSNGYGEFSEVLKAGYYQQIPPPSNVKAKIEEHTENGLLLTWDEVPSAIVYKIYTSVVPIGSPSNSFVFLGKPKENNYSCEIERGKRHYFQLTAENSAQWSQRSAAIYLDVE